MPRRRSVSLAREGFRRAPSRLPEAPNVRSRAVTAAAFALLIVTFVADALTPQTLVIAILLDVPIVLAALTRSRRLTMTLVIAALAADAAAGVINAAHDGYRWDAISAGNRLLSMLSIVLVGYLSTAVQERAERVGRLAAQEARARREATLAAAAERIRASLSPELVMRAIVREAPARSTRAPRSGIPRGSDGEMLAARSGEPTWSVLDQRPPPEIATLTHRVAEDAHGHRRARRPIRSAASCSNGLQARSAIAIPLADRGTSFGVLVAASSAEKPDENAVADGASFRDAGRERARTSASVRASSGNATRRWSSGKTSSAISSMRSRTICARRSSALALDAAPSRGRRVRRAAGALRAPCCATASCRSTTCAGWPRRCCSSRGSSRATGARASSWIELGPVAREIGSELHAMADARGVVLAVDAERRGAGARRARRPQTRAREPRGERAGAHAGGAAR